MEMILTHKNADFDAIASSIAASMVYPGAMPYLPASINPNVKNFLSMHKYKLKYQESGNPQDLDSVKRIIIVDANRWERIENSERYSSLNAAFHVWDHHPGESDINAEWSCVQDCGSATSLLVTKIIEKRIPVSVIEATLFLAGIYEDTGNLSFPGSRGIDARAVAFLLDNGADLDIVNSFLKPKYGHIQKQLLFRMIEKGNIEEVNGNRVSINFTEVKGHSPGLSLIVDIYHRIMGVDVVFGVFIDKKRNQSAVIGRSAVDSINIGFILSHLDNGGGRPRAGSGVIKSVDQRHIREMIIDIMKTKQPSSPSIGDLMSYPVITVSETATMKEVAMLFREKGCTGVPVTREKSIVGIISRSDFKKVKDTKQMEAPVKAFMSEKVINIDLNSTVSSATRLMVKHDIGRLPVMKENELIGIITRTDAMRFFYDLLPE
ncbi:MAG: CBS domain-containing protein [Desulfatiglans sp.]|jgi:nanoRNase/pAp phosphatase (c-di-AMP/oligoRNAs hydrolase)|nr:CBS domain-containing protein [Desulfatiglans sp.]